MSRKDVDLTGHWTGLYNYPDGPPVPFEAQLRESSGCVTGTTTETSDLVAGHGQTLHAVIDGRRKGGSIRFLKMYDEAEGGYDVVHYDGAIHTDGTEIECQWQIEGIRYGTFFMIHANRHGRRPEENAERMEQHHLN